MERELTEKELEQVGIGYPGTIVSPTNDELDLNDLSNIGAGYANRNLAAEKALEHPELYREKSVDRLVDEMIAAEEHAAAIENSNTQGMRR